METRLALRARESFIVDVIFPAGAVHLIGGNSGVGKTTWLLKFVKLWVEGGLFLDRYQCNPCEYVYVSADRHSLDTDRTLRRLGMGDWDLPLYSIEDVLERNAKGKLQGEANLEALFKAFPTTKLFFIEGFQSFITDPPKGRSQNKHEQVWMSQVRDQLLQENRTIIATTHIAKSSGEAGDARSQFLGSQSLIGACSTMVKIETADPASFKRKSGAPVNPSMDRMVRFLGRDYPNHNALYTRDEAGDFLLDALTVDGTPGANIFDNENDQLFKLDTQLSAIERGKELTLNIFKKWADSSSIPLRTLERWVSLKVKSHELVRPVRGKYMRPAKIVDIREGKM